MDEIKADEVGMLLRGRMGLILGPGISKFPGSFDDLSTWLAQQGEIEPGESYIETCDALLDAGVDEANLKEWIRERVGGQKRSALLSHLAKAKWSAVLSVSLDSDFEDRFRQEGSKRAAWPNITILPDPLISPPPGTIPVFKLLGLAARDDFVYSSAAYIAKRATWRHAVKGFADHTSGNPVLCLGMSDCPAVLFDLIGEMLGDHSAMPSCLLLLSDDPLCGNSRLAQLLKRRGRLAKVQGTVGNVASAVAARQKQGYGPSLPFPTESENRYQDLYPYHDLVTVVNEQLAPSIPIGERNRLLDLLFSPSVPSWDAFAHGLDFQRTVTPLLRDRLISDLKDRYANDGAVVATGASSTGKSMILKRLAWEVAKSGSLVVWLKPWFYHDTNLTLARVFQAVAKITEDAGNRILVVMDDPVTFGSLTAAMSSPQPGERTSPCGYLSGCGPASGVRATTSNSSAGFLYIFSRRSATVSTMMNGHGLRIT